MTTVKFILDNAGNVQSFCVKGHSGYAEHGSDIVCAAISAAVQMLEIGLAEVIGEELASFSCNERTAEIFYSLPDGLPEEDILVCGKMMAGFMKYLRKLGKNYTQHLSFETEVKKC